MPGIYYMTVKDYTNEQSTMRVESVPLTAANYDAQVTQSNDLFNATLAVSLGVTQRTSLGSLVDLSGSPSTNPISQRENKWLVTMTDDSDPTRKLSVEIPCADISNADLFVLNSDVADLTATEWVNWIAAFEAFARAPVTGSTVTVQTIRYVGRNL